jgi:hypothetical protein
VQELVKHNTQRLEILWTKLVGHMHSFPITGLALASNIMQKSIMQLKFPYLKYIIKYDHLMLNVWSLHLARGRKGLAVPQQQDMLDF